MRCVLGSPAARARTTSHGATTTDTSAGRAEHGPTAERFGLTVRDDTADDFADAPHNDHRERSHDVANHHIRLWIMLPISDVSSMDSAPSPDAARINAANPCRVTDRADVTQKKPNDGTGDHQCWPHPRVRPNRA